MAFVDLATRRGGSFQSACGMQVAHWIHLVRFFAAMVRWLVAQYDIMTVRCLVSVSVAIQNTVQDVFAIKLNCR